MSSFFRALRLAWLHLRKQPMATAIAIAGLAIGMGGSVAVFSGIEHLVVRSVPFPEPDELVVIQSEQLEQGTIPASYPDFQDWREGVDSFRQLAAVGVAPGSVSGGAEPERVVLAHVTPNLFEALGVAPVAGRSLREGAPGAQELLVSADLAVRRYGGSSRAMGQKLIVDGQPYTVAGVMPRELTFPPRAEVWLSLDPDDERWNLRGSRSLTVVGRLADGATVEQAQEELNGIQQSLAAQFPESNADVRVRLLPLRREIAGSAANRLLVLFAAVVFLLLISCFNFAGVMVAAAEARYDFLAIQMVLGAGRGRLILQLLIESVLVALAGGVVGLLLAHYGFTLVERLIPPHLAVDGSPVLRLNVLAFALGLSLLAGVVVGVLISFRASRRARQGSALSHRSIAGRPGGQRVRRLLVGGQVALTVVLVSAVGLLLRSFVQMQQVDPGFEAEGRVTLELSVPRSQFEHPTHRSAVYAEVVDRVRALPGVEAAAVTSALPLGARTDVLRLYHTGVPHPHGYDVLTLRVSSDYFRAMGVEVQQGRGPRGDFQPAREAVVNRRMAQALWPDSSPIGRDVSFSSPFDEAYRVVGVAEDVRHRGLDVDPGFQIYLPFHLSPGERADLVVSASEGEVQPSQLREVVAAVLPNQPIGEVRTMSRVVGAYLEQGVVILQWLAVFALASLALAMIGIYGVVALSVSQRGREIGVRMALGASRKQILVPVVRQALVPVALGLAIGLLGSSAVSRMAATVLYGVAPLELVALTLALASLTVAALIALWVPSRRALRVDAARTLHAN